MKKITIAFLVLFLIASIFVGCTNTKTDTATETNSSEITDAPKETQTDSDEEDAIEENEKSDVTLTFLASQDWIYEPEYALAEKFEEQTGISLDYQIVPAGQYFNLLLTKLNSGECTDLFGSQSGKYDIVSQLNIEENAIDLSNEPWAERFDEFSAAELTANGKLYGVTIYDNTNDFYVVYNRKIFDELSLEEPTTFDEFKTVCEAIKESGTIPFYECIADGWHHVMWFCEIGPRYEELVPGLFDKLNNNEITFSQVQYFSDCINQIVEMAELGYWGDNYLSDTYEGLPRALNEGNYAMTMAKPGTIKEIVQYNPDNCSEEDFGLFLIPTLDNQIYNVHPCGPSRFIYSGSEHVEEAKAFIDFLCQTENLQYMIDNEARFENLPFSGLTPAYSDYTKQFIDSQTKKGVVLQDEIKYLNPQWFDIGLDITAILTGTGTTEEAVRNIDIRRAEQAEANNDANWVN